MNTEIKKYLEDKKWAPLDLLCSEFDITRTELSPELASLLTVMDVRIDRDIVHITED